ncbi:phage protein [Streptococcus pneumoniae]|nr:phage protein [Streptococcus pneumoniae]VKZ91503.1 phage protein [Streptococcus pneumoniae]VLC43739.1 phage protein [Streptococcus pneumoniae]VNK54024.1 phage protein [Streptococcus pneumoniae]VOY91223.1 phage protein [Streptococcus pneumoniae]
MKKYIKENQVYTVQEGSELEAQLIADGFEELVADGGELETPNETKDKGEK